jgi:hypothetical protein
VRRERRAGRLAVIAVAGLAAVVLSACGDGSRRADDSSALGTACGDDVRRVVETFATRLRRVSLLGPDNIVRNELKDAYGDLVAPELLAEWQRAPSQAPGRDVSSPWPARIDVRDVQPTGDGCRVEGDVVYTTSADTSAAADRRTVTLRLRDDGGWKVAAYEQQPDDGSPSSEPADSTATGAATAVRRYYDEIRAARYDSAYVLWGDEGRASGQTRAEFAAGFAETAEVRVSIGDSVRVEGAAGSQYATVPVTVDAVLRDGRRQHFEGTYTLRRSMVDGATPAQRRWHITSAKVREKPGA